jgi:hypothetical protein
MRPWLLACAALTLPYLPIALWAMTVVGGTVSTWQPDLSLFDAVRIVLTKFSVNRLDERTEHRALVLMGTLVITGIVSLVRRRQRERWWLLLTLVTLVPIVGLWMLSLRQSVFSDRYVIVALPGWIMLSAAGLGALLRGARTWPLGVLAMFFVIALSWAPIRDVDRSSQAEKEDWRSAWADLGTRAQPGDAIIVYPGYLETTYAYFAQRQGNLAGYPLATIPSFRVGWLDRALMATMIAEQAPNAHRIWLIQSPDRVPAEDPDGELASWLNDSGVVIYDREVNGVRLTLYDLDNPTSLLHARSAKISP